MRWPVKPKPEKIYPSYGALKYKITFAVLPHQTDATSGEHGWEKEWIWLEPIVKIQRYFASWPDQYFENWHTWGWYPVNEFTKSLIKESEKYY